MRIRWTLPVLNVAILLTGASWVDAQYGGRDDYPLTLRSSTIQEGAQRGLADLLRSQGQQAKLNAEAAVIFGQAQQEALETRKAAIETYYDIRQRARELRAAERGPRPDAETVARLARARRPRRLSAAELDPLTGRLDWPDTLRSEAFADTRAQLEELFDLRSYTRYLTDEQSEEARNLSEAMQARLKDRIRDLRPSDYMQAKRFLESIGW